MSNRPPHPGQIRIRLTESDPCLAMNEAWKPRCWSHFGHTRKSSNTSTRLISSLTFSISRYSNMLLREATSVRLRRTWEPKGYAARMPAGGGQAKLLETPERRTHRTPGRAGAAPPPFYRPVDAGRVAGISLVCWETTNIALGDEQREQAPPLR